MDTHRAERISEALREELSEMISYELSDPRVADAIVTEVLVSPDRKRAQVRLHMSDDPQKQRETIAALDHARNFLRRQLAERLSLFRVPDLHFEADVDPFHQCAPRTSAKARPSRPSARQRRAGNATLYIVRRKIYLSA